MNTNNNSNYVESPQLTAWFRWLQQLKVLKTIRVQEKGKDGKPGRNYAYPLLTTLLPRLQKDALARNVLFLESSTPTCHVIEFWAEDGGFYRSEFPWIRETMKQGEDFKVVGNMVSYQRRYHVYIACQFAPVDDDAASTSGGRRVVEGSPSPTSPPPPTDDPKMTKLRSIAAEGATPQEKIAKLTNFMNSLPLGEKQGWNASYNVIITEVRR